MLCCKQQFANSGLCHSWKQLKDLHRMIAMNRVLVHNRPFERHLFLDGGFGVNAPWAQRILFCCTSSSHGENTPMAILPVWYPVLMMHLQRRHWRFVGDRLHDTQEGSSFPCASALFLRGSWNVLWEEHKLLPGLLMDLPTGRLTRLTTP